MEDIIKQIKNEIIEIPNFPIEGILFRDISNLLKNSLLFKRAVTLMWGQVETPDYWIGVESRGFLFASALSTMFGGGILMCRKQGKLPPPIVSLDYRLEYGDDILEMKAGTGKVIIVDDILATGGTITAAENLAIKAGYTVIDRLTMIDLNIADRKDVKSIIKY